MLTPYQFASNRPIDGVDLDGLEFMKRTSVLLYKGDPTFKQVTASDVLILNAEVWDRATFKSGLSLQSTNPYNDETSKFQMSKRNNTRMAELGNKYSEPANYTKDRVQYNKSAGVRARNNSAKAGPEVILTELLTMYQTYRLIKHNEDNQNDLKYSTESIFAVHNAHSLMHKVLEDNILPKSITSNKTVLQRITRFLVDGTGSNPGPDVVGQMIAAVGLAIYENRDAIMDGTYNMNLKVQTPECNGCDGTSDHPVFIPIFKLGSHDKPSENAINKIKEFERTPQEKVEIRQN